MKPDYSIIFADMIKFGKTSTPVNQMVKVENICCSMDVIKINHHIKHDAILKSYQEGQRLKSYDEQSIREILKFQSKNNLNNTQTANQFKLSRNTVSKWKKMYPNSD